MTTDRWDPDTYLLYASERSRPYAELLARVDADAPRVVVDLGCGPGQLTAGLARRWPSARVLGVDSSPEMISAATQYTSDRVRFGSADVRTFAAASGPGSVDVMVSNATLQWVPEHREILPGLVGTLRVGGWLAFQVPGNFDAPSHRLLRELAATAPYAEFTTGVARPASHDPQVYLDDLAATGCEVDVWETTYSHVLQGPDPVFTWISSTGARPVLQSLPSELRGRFEREYKARLRVAYPARPHGTVLAFRRIFAVAHRT